LKIIIEKNAELALNNNHSLYIP